METPAIAYGATFFDDATGYKTVDEATFYEHEFNITPKIGLKKFWRSTTEHHLRKFLGDHHMREAFDPELNCFLALQRGFRVKRDNGQRLNQREERTPPNSCPSRMEEPMEEEEC